MRETDPELNTLRLQSASSFSTPFPRLCKIAIQNYSPAILGLSQMAGEQNGFTPRRKPLELQPLELKAFRGCPLDAGWQLTKGRCRCRRNGRGLLGCKALARVQAAGLGRVLQDCDLALAKALAVDAAAATA